MLNKIRALFSGASAEVADDEAALHLAAAALLVEVARADHDFDDAERARLREVLARDWHLSAADVHDLVEVASDAAEDRVSLHEQVDLINRSLQPAGKVSLVRALWQIACADGAIHHHEEALVRRLADLLHVSHTDFIRTKHQVLESR